MPQLNALAMLGNHKSVTIQLLLIRGMSNPCGSQFVQFAASKCSRMPLSKLFVKNLAA